MATKKFKSHRQAAVAVAQAAVTSGLSRNLSNKLIRTNLSMLAVLRDCHQANRAPTAAEIEACMVEDFTTFVPE